MITKLIIALAIIFSMAFILYRAFVLTLHIDDKDRPRGLPKWLNPFNKPIFKIPIGVLIIASTLVYSFKVVKVIPLIAKLGLLGFNFIIIYSVITFLFKIKK